MSLKRTIAFFLMLVSPAAKAATLAGVNLPDQETLAGHKLKLNGIALRQATIFHIPVYVAGLYLESPARNEYLVLGSPEVKELVMVFRHDASAEKLTNAWRDAFNKNCGPAPICDRQAPQFASFAQSLKDMRSGEWARLRIFDNRLEMLYSNRRVTIAGGQFANTVLATFIGKAGDQDVKRDLLKARPLVDARG